MAKSLVSTDVKREELRGIRVVFYDPAERAREKAAQRFQDEKDIAAGRLREVEERNHWIKGPFTPPADEWETELPADRPAWMREGF